MKYINFDIELYEFEQKDGCEKFSVRVTNSPAGDQSPSQSERVILPDKLRKATYIREPNLSTGLNEAIEYGEALADCLLPHGVRQRLFESIRLLREDEALRLRLKFDAWQLANIAWEYIYASKPAAPSIKKEIDGFLALDRRISITRYEYTQHLSVPFEVAENVNIRQLVLLSNPTDTTQLNLDKEAKYISESLQSITNLTTEFLTNPTIEMIQDGLDHPAHLFHFAGHGDFISGERDGSVEGKGYIVVCDPYGDSMRFPADKLAINLVRCGVRVAFLSSANSARRDSSSRLSGIASALAYAGIPAVIGFNGEMTDRDAIAFSRTFYRTLAAGNSIDTAVTNGRVAIFNNTDGLFWGVPVLYLRGDDNVIFPIRPKLQKDLERRLSMPSNLTLRDILVEHFNKEELDLLCADITDVLNRDGIQQRVNLEIVGGNTLHSQAMNLIQHLERRGLLRYLIEVATTARPNLLQLVKG